MPHEVAAVDAWIPVLTGMAEVGAPPLCTTIVLDRIKKLHYNCTPNVVSMRWIV